MIVDAHVHLQPHGEAPPVNRALIESYVAQAQRNGVDVVVFTEHLFRFKEALQRLDGWWDCDPDPALRKLAREYWADHVNLSMAEYAGLIEQAKSDGLPVRLGLEMDWIPGHGDDLRALLKPYAWDCILGSIHFLGAFGIDIDECLDEWRRRDVNDVWEEYTQFVEDLADARIADTIGHPDVVKVWGFRPGDEAKYQKRIVEAAARNGMALEVNTNGWRKPVAELYPAPAMLQLARQRGVPITLGSDAHTADRLGQRFGDAIANARAAGYEDYLTFVAREPVKVALP
jgi:histidinol-phosphatase (PHP family)